MSEQLDTLLERLKVALKSIDLRVAATTQADDKLSVVMTTIRFTYQTPDKVKEHYDALEKRWGKVDRRKLKVLCEALPFTEWPRLAINLHAGSIPIQDQGALIKSLDLSTAGPMISPSYALLPEEWKLAEFNVSTRGSLASTFASEAKALGFPDWQSLFSSWFGLTNMAYNYDLIIGVPLLAKIIRHDMDGTGRVEASVRYHKALDNLMLSISTNVGFAQPVLELVKVQIANEKSTPISEDFREFTYKAELSPIPNNRLDVRVIHTVPTGLDFDEATRLMHEYLQARKPAENPFVWSFNRFCPLEEYELQLKDPVNAQIRAKLAPEKVFERAVGWLLSMCGLRVARLEEYEKLRSAERTAQLDSVDVLAWDDQLGILFLIACTIGLPKIEEDAITIKETASKIYEDIFKDTNVRIIPVIFSAFRDLSPLRDKASDYKVTIIDSTGAERMLDLVKLGKTADAVQIMIKLAG